MDLVSATADAISLVAEMTWETWWALVLGFTLSGAVEVFVSEERMTTLLGDDGWREVAYGSAFGAASSSCSYSAVGTAKSLFKKGASGVSSFVYMFASTDLVIELGLVMWVLLGWEFVVGEYLGGVIAVVVIAWVFRNLVPERWFDAARTHLHGIEETTCAACGMDADPTVEETVTLETTGGTEYFCCVGCLRAYRSQHDIGSDTEVSLREKLLTPAGWDTAAKKTMADWEMLWRDIALGFVLAGLVGAFVPEAWWTALFGVETGFEAVVRNTVIAVLIGIATFMCSVGNVPFALVLWRNGLPFGSVLAFIYADLLIPPLLRAYKRYYGTRMAVVLGSALFLAAVVAGVAVHYLMGGVGLIPRQGVPGGTLSGGYTLALNLLFTPIFLGQAYVAYGPERIARVARETPTRARSAFESARTATERVRRAGWAFALDVGEAVVALLESVRLFVATLAALWRALSVIVGAVVTLTLALWKVWSERDGEPERAEGDDE